ncbi:MAG: LapA family protein [Peptococcaceae bacterium]|nr:LapA family protein [Peptococcaceae bacterium]
MQFYLFLLLIFAIVVAIFAVQNAGPVTIHFLVWAFEDISLSLVVLGSVAVGAVMALIFGFIRQLKLSWRIRELTAKVADLQLKAGQQEEPPQK